MDTLPLISTKPYQLWCKSGSRFSKRGKAYASYAILRNYEFMDAMIYGYKMGFIKRLNYWSSASREVKKIPVCFFSFLAAATLVGNNKAIANIKKEPNYINFESPDPLIAGINDFLNNRGKDVIKLFFSDNSLEYFHLSLLQENAAFTRKIIHGDTVNISFNGDELLVFMGKNDEGYHSMKKGSEEYKAIVDLRKGERFQIGPLEGEIIEIMD